MPHVRPARGLCRRETHKDSAHRIPVRYHRWTRDRLGQHRELPRLVGPRGAVLRRSPGRHDDNEGLPDPRPGSGQSRLLGGGRLRSAVVPDRAAEVTRRMRRRRHRLPLPHAATAVSKARSMAPPRTFPGCRAPLASAGNPPGSQGRFRRRRVVCLRSGLRPSLRHTTRTVPHLSHEHWYRNWEGVSKSTREMCEQ
jgi:hypothetical protein